jgi:hypothetical protein
MAIPVGNKLSSPLQSTAAEQTRLQLLFSQSPVTFAFPLLAAAALVILLRDSASGLVLSGWAGIVGVHAAVRYRMLYCFHRAGADDAPAWINRLAGGAFVSGTLWGAAPILLIPYDPVRLIEFTMYNSLTLIVICGLAAGAVVAYACSLRVLFCFTAPALLPPALYLISLGDYYNSALGGFVLLYFIFIAIAGVRMHGQLHRHIHVEQEMNDLRRQLRDSRRRLEALTRTQAG